MTQMYGIIFIWFLNKILENILQHFSFCVLATIIWKTCKRINVSNLFFYCNSQANWRVQLWCSIEVIKFGGFKGRNQLGGSIGVFNCGVQLESLKEGFNKGGVNGMAFNWGVELGCSIGGFKRMVRFKWGIQFGCSMRVQLGSSIVCIRPHSDKHFSNWCTTNFRVVYIWLISFKFETDVEKYNIANKVLHNTRP